MPDHRFPPGVLALLREHVTTFERLEIVLLLHATPGQDWTAAAVSGQTRIDPDLAREALDGLEAGRLVQQAPAPRAAGGPAAYRIDASDAEKADALTTLALLYRDQHAAVMSVMSMNAIERIRSGTIRAFADSFVLGKKKKPGKEES